MYVPVLRLKQGEKKAVSELDNTLKPNIMPLFFIGEGNESSPEVQCEFFKKDWPFNAYYEREYYDINVDYSELFKCSVFTLTPVYSDYNLEQLQLILPLIEHAKSCCIRISCSDIDARALKTKAEEMLRQITLSANDVDIILDFETIEAGKVNLNKVYAESLIKAINSMGWRKIIYLASSLPNGVTGFEKFKILEFPHEEWYVWNELKNEGLNIFYGDYASVSAELDYDGDLSRLRPAAKIRYLCENCWLLVRGEQLKKGYEQFRQLSRLILNDSRFAKPIECFADRKIKGCANGTEGTGNLTTWVSVAVNRHLTFIANQLAS